MKICVIIPVYNESKAIGRLIGELKPLGHDIVVVDDGSTDGSGDIAREKGVFVLRHDKKMGKGCSLQDGFAHAVAKGYDAVITMDGDGQHAVSDIANFVREAKEPLIGIVNGSRMTDCEGMPLLRLWTNRFMSWIISLICRQPVPDSQCGFRLIRCDILKKLPLSCADFEIETEVLIKASRQGVKISSVPVRTIYRDETSKINPVVDTFRFFSYIVRELRSGGKRPSASEVVDEKSR
jgi:glycosyltransferase involved in cell wall biosynthesis